jgi:hypothetical protein
MEKAMSKFKIDATNPDNISNKPTNEAETRKKFLTVAGWAGRHKDMLTLFYKFDKLRYEAKTEDQKKDIGKIGAIEVYRLLGDCFATLKANGALVLPGVERGELWVDGELVYKEK